MSDLRRPIVVHRGEGHARLGAFVVAHVVDPPLVFPGRRSARHDVRGERCEDEAEEREQQAAVGGFLHAAFPLPEYAFCPSARSSMTMPMSAMRARRAAPVGGRQSARCSSASPMTRGSRFTRSLRYL